jgi:hypothetical protein
VDDDRVGAIAARKNAFFQARPVSHLDAVISTRVGNEQSLGVYSIPDGSASLMELPLRLRERSGEVVSEMLANCGERPPWADLCHSRAFWTAGVLPDPAFHAV